MLLAVFIAGIIILMLLIVKFKINPFIALLAVAIMIGFGGRLPLAEIPVEIAKGFGSTMQSIGIVIALGIVLGQLLYETGGTEEIANLALRKVGVKRSPLAMNITGFIVSIPVFFDAAFVILVSIAKQLAKKTGIPFARFVTALAVGLIVTHCLVIPTPGPMAVAGQVNAEIAPFVFYSILVGVPASIAGGILYSKFTVDKFFPKDMEIAEDETKTEINVDKGERPSGELAVFLILLPIVMILLGTVVTSIITYDSNPGVYSFFSFIGDKNIALFAGVVVAMLCLKKYLKRSMEEVLTEAAEQAGMVFLITGAGGSFGQIINATGIGEYLVTTMSNFNVPLLVLAFLLSLILRAAQGSATVALVTTASIVAPTIASMGASPVLVGLAICCGGMGVSLPNDSGFWVVNRFSGFTFTQTLKSWTAGCFTASIVGFACVMILSLFQGVLPGL